MDQALYFIMLVSGGITATGAAFYLIAGGKRKRRDDA
jgi:hypothetical protein